MEKIVFLPNGQWQLEKTRPHIGNSYIYNLNSSDKSKSYSDEDLHRNQMDVLSLYQKHRPNSIKIMPHNGKDEYHVLMHRGESLSAKNANKQDPNGFNRYAVSDTHVNFPSDSVNTMDYGHAKDYADGDKQKNTHSFWVPISKIHAHGGSHVDSALDPRHHNIDDIKDLYNDESDMRSYLDSSDKELRDEAESNLREYAAADLGSHHYENGHIAIMPGKYQRASQEELKNSNTDSKPMANSLSINNLIDSRNKPSFKKYS